MIEQVDGILLCPLPAAQQYLVNRYQGMLPDLRNAIADAGKPAPPAGHSQKYLARVDAQLKSGLDLLAPTLASIAAARQTQLDATKIVMPGAIGGTLAQRIQNVFDNGRYQTGPTSSRALNLEDIHLVNLADILANATPAEKLQAAQDTDFIAAAARIIDRDSLPQFLQNLGANEPGRVAHLNPADVDAAIRTVLGRMVERPVARGVTLAGNTVILKDFAFGKIKAKYTGSIPGGGTVNAFTEEGIVCMRASGGEPSTMIHEGIHLYAEGSFRKTFGDNFDEGVTEYFARIVVTNASRRPALPAAVRTLQPRTSYADELAIANVFIARLGEAAFADAYFNGSTMRMLAQFIEVRTRAGYPRKEAAAEFPKFSDALKSKTFAEAKRLIGLP